MKNSKEYAQKIKKLFTTLKKKAAKIKKPNYSDPVEAVIFASVSEITSETTAKAIIKKLKSHFVDNNDLRVSRNEEIFDVIGKDSSEIEKIATTLTILLNSIFQKYDKVSLAELSEQGKKNAKETLEKFDGMTDFICAYTMLSALEAHAIPLTAKMLKYLKTSKLVDNNAKPNEIAAFLERQVLAANGYTFYTLLRHEAESARPKSKNRSITNVKKTKKKTAKKSKK